MSQLEVCSVHKLYTVLAWLCGFSLLLLWEEEALLHILSPNKKQTKKWSEEQNFLKKYLLKFKILLWLYSELSGRSNKYIAVLAENITSWKTDMVLLLCLGEDYFMRKDCLP